MLLGKRKRDAADTAASSDVDLTSTRPEPRAPAPPSTGKTFTPKKEDIAETAVSHPTITVIIEPHFLLDETFCAQS
jgi:hypothetical protein